MELNPGYSCPDGYKQTEVGVIPEVWAVKSIGDLNPFVTSGSRGWAAFYSDRGEPFIRITNLSRSSIYLDLEDLKSVKLPPDANERTRTQLEEHDVLVSITADIGIIGYVSSNVPIPSYINQHIALVRFDASKTNSRFVSYFLASETPQKQFRALTDSGAKAGMSLGTVRKIQFAHPPLAEQEAIAEALSDADALMESLEQLIAKKRHFKQGAMQELLTGKKRLPGFGGKWGVKIFAQLFDFSGGFSASRDQLSSEGHCYLHYGDIHKSSKTFIDLQAEYQEIPKLDIPLKRVSPASLLDDGDVVFVDASEDDEGASKHVVIINKDKASYIAGLHTIVAKSKTDGLDHKYLRYCFQTRDIKRQFYYYAVGTKVTGISKTNIAKLVLPVPPRSEQTAIATILSDMDTEIAALEAKLAKTRQLKQGMMHNLLTGKIRLV